MLVAVAKVELYVPESHSLKAKRQVVRKVLDRVRARFKISAAEVGSQDLWQKAELGFAYVTSDRSHGESVIRKVTRFVEDLYVAPVVSCQTDVLVVDQEEEWRSW
ncbi:MAG: DUF503 domain-containing protein [Deltaproteobacteria bacterium]|nr:DUF503 domain-containing protein [Deltaproteobacteria bacterium]